LNIAIRVIRPSSREQENLLPSRLSHLRERFSNVLYDDLEPDPNWAYSAALPLDRAQALTNGLFEKKSDFILCARGGYGASDLLPFIDWKSIRDLEPKFIIGFSDVSALHSAFYTQCKWPGLHAPMPATSLWEKNSALDTDELYAILSAIKSQQSYTGKMPVTSVLKTQSSEINGTLFGGCFSVLTNLIGTPYFPKSLENHIVFIEDIDEHPGRLMRALNQWIQSGALNGVRGMIIGYLKSLGAKIPDNAPFVLQEIAKRISPTPLFHTPLFGHTSPNFPLIVGSHAKITPENGELLWTWKTPHLHF
jgi:muramoyltetrapeptide carboxypeptidase